MAADGRAKLNDHHINSTVGGGGWWQYDGVYLALDNRTQVVIALAKGNVAFLPPVYFAPPLLYHLILALIESNRIESNFI